MKALIFIAALSFNAAADWNFIASPSKGDVSGLKISAHSMIEDAGLFLRCSHNGYEFGVRVYNSYTIDPVKRISMSFDSGEAILVPVSTVDGTGFFIKQSHKASVMEKMSSAKKLTVRIDQLSDRQKMVFNIAKFSNAKTVVGCQ